MDLFEVFRIACRRWRVLLPALGIACALGFITSLQVAPTYVGGGVLVVNFPYAADEAASARLQANPYYDTRTSASLLSTIADAPDVRDAVGAAGGSTQYKVLLDSGRPVIVVTVSDKNQTVALDTYRVLAQELGRRLTDLQVAKRIPPESRVTVDDALQPREAALSTGSRTKVLFASLALGIVLSIGLCVYVDYRLRERSRRTSDAGAGEPDDEAVPGADPTPEVADGRPISQSRPPLPGPEAEVRRGPYGEVSADGPVPAWPRPSFEGSVAGPPRAASPGRPRPSPIVRRSAATGAGDVLETGVAGLTQPLVAHRNGSSHLAGDRERDGHPG